jgi:hypothetical protein
MNCPNCRTPVLQFPIQEEFRSYVPGEAAGGYICPSCLTVEPDENAATDHPDYTEISDAFPNTAETAVPMALSLGLLQSLALNRSEINELFQHMEEEGVDPLLVLEELAESTTIDSRLDLRGRKRQLEQLME